MGGPKAHFEVSTIGIADGKPLVERVFGCRRALLAKLFSSSECRFLLRPSPSGSWFSSCSSTGSCSFGAPDFAFAFALAFVLADAFAAGAFLGLALALGAFLGEAFGPFAGEAFFPVSVLSALVFFVGASDLGGVSSSSPSSSPSAATVFEDLAFGLGVSGPA